MNYKYINITHYYLNFKIRLDTDRSIIVRFEARENDRNVFDALPSSNNSHNVHRVYTLHSTGDGDL